MLILNPDLLDSDCGCGSGKSYRSCCYPLHSGEVDAEIAEQLMRSRFVAFQLQLKEYLLKTWHETTRPEESELEFNSEMKWLSLNINGRKKGRNKDKEGWVTFNAIYRVGSAYGSLHEKSYFIRNAEGSWRYVDGEIKS